MEGNSKGQGEGLRTFFCFLVSVLMFIRSSDERTPAWCGLGYIHSIKNESQSYIHILFPIYSTMYNS